MMSNFYDNSEIVHEGWLTKSPPTTRIWRARWRKRWFVLKHAGQIPGQYLLCYFTDRNCRKIKGQIDLDQCEQVDAGLRFEHRKQKYQHMFDLKTPRRTYYLAADTEDEMNRWVDAICHICGLKTFPPVDGPGLGVDGEFGYDPGLMSQPPPGRVLGVDSPPISPTSSVSGPYIPISECISGKPLSSPDGLSDFLALQHYATQRFQYQQQQGPGFESQIGQEPNDTALPRTMRHSANTGYRPGNLDLRKISAHRDHTSGGYRLGDPPELTPPPLGSPPGTDDGESVFTDDESVVTCGSSIAGGIKPRVNWETFPRPSDSSLEGELSKPPPPVSSSLMSANKRFTRSLDPEPAVTLLAPPRPPKPNHLVTTPTGTAPACHCSPGQSCDVCEGGRNATSDVGAPCSAGGTSLGTSSALNVSQGTVSETLSPTQLHEEQSPVEHSIINQQIQHDSSRSQQLTADSKKSSSSLCYSNAPSPSRRHAPGNVSGEIFRYDFDTPPQQGGVGGLSGSGPAGFLPPLESPPVYSNMHSPSNLSTPPLVNRELKPGRKLSDSTNSNEASPVLVYGTGGPSPLYSSAGVGPPVYGTGGPSPLYSGAGMGPPNIDRKLKPPALAGGAAVTVGHKKQDSLPGESPTPLTLASPPTGGSFARRRQRAAPSPVPPLYSGASLYNSGAPLYSSGASQPRRHSTSDDDVRMMYSEDQVYLCNNTKFLTLGYSRQRPAALDKIQYLDLDFLDTSAPSTNTSASSTNTTAPFKLQVDGSMKGSTSTEHDSRNDLIGTTYKTIDFLKTEAFNRTRQQRQVELQSKPSAQATL
uniref:Protein daughter of sevenless n=1 Tax=Cacopsylla melanoneura TaxID=428564 RepID=A0A8D8RHQ7_9HEMI